MSKILEDTNITEAKKNGSVLIGGCFDILHPAHLEFLKKAKAVGQNLVLLLESDQNIKKTKGHNRPMNNQIVRAENLSNTKLVDYIVLLKTPDSSEYYYNLVKLLEPDIIAVTSNDPLLEVKKDQAKLVGGEVITVMDRNKDFSSTVIINKKK